MTKVKENSVGFFRNWFGNTNKYGVFEYSFKKFGLVLATMIAYVTPTLLLVFQFPGMTAELWLSFYKIVFPSTAALYAGGKWIDGKNGGTTEE